MPGMNGKGPLGNGPLTGGQRGVCKQTGTDKTDQPQDTTWMSCRGRVEGWADARVVRAVVLEKAKEEARVEVVTADRELVYRRMSTE